MQSNHKYYNYFSSFDRIDKILATPRGNYEEVNSLPDRSKLTFSNGFYAYCSAVFVDIRDSSKLPSYYDRPILAKIYRAYISEVVAILNSTERTKEINIVGDGVWAVINTPSTDDIDTAFSLICQINSLMQVLNCKLFKAGYNKVEVKAGIGASYGRALMIKAGYDGSGINDVVYMGDVVNQAAKLAAQGSKGYSLPICLDKVFAENLNDANRRLLVNNWVAGYYTSDAVSSGMSEWYSDNCT